MRKFKLTLIAIILVAILTTITAYAVNTSIAEAITSGIASIKAFFVSKAPTAVDSIETAKNEAIKQFAITKSAEINDALESHFNQEVAKADSELQQFISELEAESNQAIQAELEVAKQSITEAVNSKKDEAKGKIVSEMAKQLKDNIKKD